MKVEHTLSEVQQAWVRRTLQDLRQANTNYFSMIGQAQEMKRDSDLAAATLGQMLKLV